MTTVQPSKVPCAMQSASAPTPQRRPMVLKVCNRALQGMSKFNPLRLAGIWITNL